MLPLNHLVRCGNQCYCSQKDKKSLHQSCRRYILKQVRDRNSNPTPNLLLYFFYQRLLASKFSKTGCYFFLLITVNSAFGSGSSVPWSTVSMIPSITKSLPKIVLI